MLLRNLGFNEANAEDEAVAILVGPNGSGKSNHLRKIAIEYHSHRDVTVISNTTYDRFLGIRGINRHSSGRTGQSPKATIKRAVAATLDREGSEFYQISATLEFCGYLPRIGFRIERSQAMREASFDPSDRYGPFFRSQEEYQDFEDSRHFLERWREDEIIWIDSKSSVLEFSRRREFAAVLRSEQLLYKAKLLRRIHVYLEKEYGAPFELQHASSGELSLISSLVFLITTVGDNAIVLIDEPENSLHPSWQRDYIDKVLGALMYRNASIVVATHAPLVVTGATTQRPNHVTVYQVRNGNPDRLNINGMAAGDNGIEAVLWKAFDVVTPANHFVSEEIVEAIDQYERDEINKGAVLTLIARMRARSFDPKQEEFFDAIRTLVEKVETRKASHNNNGRPAT
ncbi:AAA family ATPase [Microvirga arabica]|uniref:AAA family ATPase n=1 Tax=Microvirga arabica TaxID=1128671 RepID=UPI00193A9016|nr:ATP-binding protein [Microvirga arabica]MBM1169924.1 ATP-binding protein [Microvirga arabica]